MKIEKGTVFYHSQPGYGKKNWYKSYIVDIVVDEDDPENPWSIQVVWKYYGKHKQWWHYRMEPLGGFQMFVDEDLYVENRP